MGMDQQTFDALATDFLARVARMGYSAQDVLKQGRRPVSATILAALKAMPAWPAAPSPAFLADMDKTIAEVWKVIAQRARM